MRKCVDWLWKFVTVDKKNSSILNLTVETFTTNLNYYDRHWTLYKFKTCDNSVIQPSNIQKVFKKKPRQITPPNPKGSPCLEQQGHVTHSSQMTSVPKEIGALFMGMIEIGRRHATAVTKFIFWKLLPWGFHENSLMIQCLKNECLPVKKHVNVLRMSVLQWRSMQNFQNISSKDFHLDFNI